MINLDGNDLNELRAIAADQFRVKEFNVLVDWISRKIHEKQVQRKKIEAVKAESPPPAEATG